MKNHYKLLNKLLLLGTILLFSAGQVFATASNLTTGNYSVTITDATGAYVNVPFTLTQPAPPHAIYVKANATGANNGTSWADAYTDFQAAINATAAGDSVFVAAGTYQPASGQFFTMKEGVKIYGGFAGTETSFSQRNWTTNVTILKGNNNSVIRNNNNGLTQAAVLDGFTITNGMATQGGGMYNNTVSPSLGHIIFSGNTAKGGNTSGMDIGGSGIGGGMYNTNSSPVLANVTLSGNTAQGGNNDLMAAGGSGTGGGMYNISSSPVLANVTLSGNTAQGGNGGVSTGGSGTGGGMYNTNSFPVLANVTLSGNTAQGGNSSVGAGGSASGGGIYNDNTSTKLYNSIVLGNSPNGIAGSALDATSSNNLIQVGNQSSGGNAAGSGTAIVNTVPNTIFTDFANKDYSLKSNLATVNAGSNAFYNLAKYGDKDLAGNPRIQKGTIDMGAYESPYNTPAPDANGIMYVAGTGRGDSTGNSWANAIGDLQMAINANGVQQVWVAAGTYQPASGQSFSMKEGVKIYGGFSGTETELSQRDLSANHTSILKGNNNSVIRNNNNGLTNAAGLDGFTITNGRATQGGGMYNNTASPSLSHIIFNGNTAKGGDAYYDPLNLSSLTPAGSGTGGGIYNTGNSSPVLTNVTISGNRALGGNGSMMSSSGSGEGGGIYNTGNSSPVLTNVTLSGDTAESGTSSGFGTGSGTGGGVYNNGSVLTLINSIIWGNGSISLGGGGIASNNGIYNNGTLTITYSDVQDSVYAGVGNISANPLFVDSANGDYHLQAGSPAINKGNNAAIPSGITTDIAGNARIQGGTVDMGAYESPYLSLTPDANGIIYVTQTGAGNKSGNSWTNAANDLQKSIDATGVQQVWVAGGTYIPPASNGSFVMKNGVAIYGGFPAVGIPSMADRDWKTNLTILSGDENGGVVNNTFTEANPLTASATLDGFTLTKGMSGIGGGIYNEYASPKLINLTISGNAANSGGGIYNSNSSPILTNVTISGNQANSGGGIYNSNSSPVLTNITISGNTASDGGGVYNQLSSNPIIRNSIIYGNNSGIFNIGSSPVISYSLVQDSTNTANGNITSTDPQFVDAANGDYHLQSGSPVINKGNNAYYSADSIPDLHLITTDLGGDPRVASGQIDMGAYESLYGPALIPDANGIIYVTQTGSGNNSGNSWTNAANDLQKSMDATGVQQVWVAGGTYKPIYPADSLNTVDSTNRDNAFVLKKDVKIYGGFAGTETSLSQRDLSQTTNASILSGDIGMVNDSTDNACHVVISAGDVGTAELNGFTIKGGNANEDTVAITVNTETFNQSFGGGVVVAASSPSFINCIFSGNTAVFGGGMDFVLGGTTTITNSFFYNNTVFNGSTTGTGGGLQINAGAVNTVNITDCVFANNSAAGTQDDGGGGIMLYGGTVNCSGVTFYNNTTGSTLKPDANTISTVAGSTLNMNNSIVWGNATQQIHNLGTASITYNDIQGGYSGAGNISKDPQFTDPVHDGFSLKITSPAINAGSNQLYPVTGGELKSDSDIAGNPRVYDYSSGGIIDLGAYEFQGNPIDYSNIGFADSTLPYNGADRQYKAAHIPDSITTVTYTVKDSDNQVVAEAMNVGKYTIEAEFKIADGTVGLDTTVTLIIRKAMITGITLDNSTVTYDGNSHALIISGTIPAGASAIYSIPPVTDAGIYTDTAYIDGGNNYENDTLTAKLTIIGNAVIAGITLDNSTVTYNGNSHALAISGTLPAGTSVSYSNPMTDAGIYTIAAYLTGGNNYENDTLTAKLIIAKAAITGITLGNSTVTYDGNGHALAISGTLPSGASVSYSSPMTDAGIYTDTAYLTGGNNYKNDTLTAKLTIEKATIVDVIFKEATATYDGSSHSVAVDENTLPKGVIMNGYDNNDKTNAGIYTVTAHLSGGNNYNDKDITATLTINKASQTITFNAIPGKSLENDADFQLQATASSGLPVTYNYAYTASAPPATVTSGGFVKLLTSGLMKITASQAGDDNYLPAAEVIQTLQINSNNAFIFDIQVGDTTASNPSDDIHYQIDCHNSTESVSVTITAEANAIVTPGRTFVIQTPKPGTYKQQVTVTSQDGSTTKDYTITVNKAFSFKDIVVQKFNSVLLVNNNPATNGGYQFVGYKWYKNGVLVGTGPYYSAGNEINNQLDNTATYSVELTTASGEVLHTCGGVITLTTLFDAILSPNPASPGGTITLTVTLPPSELEQMRISIYSLTGNLIKTVRSSDEITHISLPPVMIPGTYIVKCETPNFHKSFKLIVQ